MIEINIAIDDDGVIAIFEIRYFEEPVGFQSKMIIIRLDPEAIQSRDSIVIEPDWPYLINRIDESIQDQCIEIV